MCYGLLAEADTQHTRQSVLAVVCVCGERVLAFPTRMIGQKLPKEGGIGTSSQDGDIGRHTVPPRTTKRTTTI